MQTDAKLGRPPIVPRDIENKGKTFGITRKDLPLRTGRLCRKIGIKTPSKGGIPGKA